MGYITGTARRQRAAGLFVPLARPRCYDSRIAAALDPRRPQHRGRPDDRRSAVPPGASAVSMNLTSDAGSGARLPDGVSRPTAAAHHLEPQLRRVDPGRQRRHGQLSAGGALNTFVNQPHMSSST